MRRLIEYRANWVSIPESMAGIPSLVCSSPVHIPAATPAATAARDAAHAGHPASISMTAVAPPVAKDPSTVRSAISSSRNVMYNPKAIRPHIMPCAMPPGIRDIRFPMLGKARHIAVFMINILYALFINCGGLIMLPAITSILLVIYVSCIIRLLQCNPQVFQCPAGIRYQHCTSWWVRERSQSPFLRPLLRP